MIKNPFPVVDVRDLAAQSRREEIDRLRAVNAELLAALQWAIERVAEPLHGNGSAYGREYQFARDAIAKATTP